MDLKSLIGYSKGSPYINHPFLDINTPSGLIDMSQTEMDLLGVDNMGNHIHMKAGSKNPYKFEGNMVREYRMQQGGSVYDFLFGDDEEDATADVPQQEQPQDNSQALEEYMAAQEQKQQEDEQYNLAMQIATDSDGGNPYVAGMSGASAGFQQFSSYEAGRSALENQLDLYQTGKTRNKVGPSSSIYQAMSVYAPAGDGKNDPFAYARFIAGKLGVPITTPISQINKKSWADAIEEMEGNRKGNNPGNLRKYR